MSSGEDEEVHVEDPLSVGMDRSFSAKGKEESLLGIDINKLFLGFENYHNRVTRTVSCHTPAIRVTDFGEGFAEGSEDADGSSQGACRLHRRTALRRTQTLNAPNSPQAGRSNRRRSPSTPNAPDPNMLQRGQDPGGGGKDITKFLLTFEIESVKETVRLPARKDHELKDVLEEALSKKGLNLADVDIYINSTNSNPLPRTDKGLKVPTEPLGGSEVFIRLAKEKSSPADTCPLDDLPGTTKRKKDLSAFLGVKDDVNSKVGPRDRRMSVPAIVSAQMDPRLIKLQKELDHYLVQGLPGFPPLLCLQYHRENDEDPKTFFMENSWKDLIDVDIQQAMSKKEKELQEGIWELLATEAKYIKQIRVIIDLYMCCLFNLQVEAILNEIETEKIFSNITDLETAHTSFWKDNLKGIVDKARTSGKPLNAHDIAVAFEGFSDHFTAYFKFCVEEESCLEYVREKTKENDILRAFFEWCEQHTMSRQLKLRGLNDLLVYPMQKITKYHLMVERVYKNCEDEVAKAALKDTFDGIVKFVSHVNHEIKKEQERKKMERVAAILEGYEVSNAPAGCEELNRLAEAHSVFDVRSPMPNAAPIHPRWLLMEGPLRLQEKGTGRTTLYAFLFTDALVLAKPSRTTAKEASEKYRIVRSPMRVDQLEVVELKDGSGFAVLCVDDYNCAMYGFVAQPERYTVGQWMEKIAQAKEWYDHACSMEDMEYFDDIPSDSPETPTVAILGQHLHPEHGFLYGPPAYSPQHSPAVTRRESSSPSSRGSNSSLQRISGEEEGLLNGEPRPGMTNGDFSRQVNNSNNHRAPEGVNKQRKGTLTKSKTYQETEFLSSDSSLLTDIITNMPGENRHKIMDTVRQVSDEDKVLPKDTMKPPKSPARIISFESDEEENSTDQPDIYFESKGKDKEVSPKRRPGTVLTATKVPSSKHRPSLPNITLTGGSSGKQASERTESSGSGEGTLKKKLWEKMKGHQNIRVTSV
ncbi:pleckstrin homology domain-containing family G member 5-like [Diadema setosum]|uniref:pleckstrin homology domain-containing family G member 5-like n=1 Tax=Diadema setosum TaxID=31175 RepID=UPI003B3A4F84